MEKVNFIIQLNSVFEKFNKDRRIKQGHITLYLAFFQKWNREYFRKVIAINSQEIRSWAKIKSKTTYHSYLKDLVRWGFLEYYPSSTPKAASRIKMIIYSPKIEPSSGSSSVQKLDSSPLNGVQNLIPSLKQINPNQNKQGRPIFEKDIINFFKENKWPEIEAKKFYIYIKTKKWKTDNWEKIAQIYAKNGFKLNEPERRSPFFGYVQNLEQRSKPEN